MLFHMEQIAKLARVVLDPDHWAVVRLAELRQAGELGARPLVQWRPLDAGTMLVDVAIRREDGSIERMPTNWEVRIVGEQHSQVTTKAERALLDWALTVDRGDLPAQSATLKRLRDEIALERIDTEQRKRLAAAHVKREDAKREFAQACEHLAAGVSLSSDVLDAWVDELLDD